MNLIEKLGDQGIILIQLFFVYNYMMFKNQYSIVMLTSIFISIFINFITKLYLIEYMKKYNHKLPILGNFCRPLDTQCKNLTGTGYGMPSGHSQAIAFLAAFYYFYYHKYDDFSKPKFITLISIAIFIMATRYTSKMHSIQQIIIGALYGILIAFILSKVIRYLDLLD